MICYFCPYWQPIPHSHTGICTHSVHVSTNGISDCIYGLEPPKDGEEQNAAV